MKRVMIIVLFGLFLTLACEKEQIIGGQRDEHGCLTPAGYAWDENVKACIRDFELDEDQKRAATIAIEYMNRGGSEFTPYYTVEKVEVMRCPGCFEVYLTYYLSETNKGTIKVIISNWVATNEKFLDETKYICTEEEKAATVCTMEYMPVCGDDGITYGNKCAACASNKIQYYTQGECQQQYLRKYLSNDPEVCKLMGIWQCDEGLTIFSDETGCGCMRLCGDCPLLTPPYPDWCKDGKIIPGDIDECGCPSPPKCEPVACTMDAKICSDGSAVGRIAPDCEFAPCP